MKRCASCDTRITPRDQYRLVAGRPFCGRCYEYQKELDRHNNLAKSAEEKSYTVKKK